MRFENLPALRVTLVVVKRKHDGSATARLKVMATDGEDLTMRTWDWETGRPTPSQLADAVATLVQEIEATIVTKLGVQGQLGVS